MHDAFAEEVLAADWNRLLLNAAVVHGVTMTHRLPLASPSERFRQWLLAYPDAGSVMEGSSPEDLSADDLHTIVGRYGDGGRWAATVTAWHDTGGGDFAVTDRARIDAGESHTGDGWVMVAAHPDGTAEIIMRGGTTHEAWRAFKDAWTEFCRDPGHSRKARPVRPASSSGGKETDG